mmetsp:Transcript_6121/g.15524  ORF Transcript_6121/g.15524 Transcript_6121/m.15524 type:complete len:645 (-) Transcript_6121:547-2481(-)
MQVQRHIGVFGTQGAKQESGSLRSEQASHILDADDVCSARLHNGAGQLDVVLERVVGASGIGHVASVGDRSLDHCAAGAGGLETGQQRVQVVERVEDAEHIHATRDRLLAELRREVVRIGTVAECVVAAQQHLEGHVGHQRTQLLQAFPRAFVQETHGHVEGGSAPHFQTVGVAQCLVMIGSCTEEIDRTNTSGQQRLMCITHGGIGHQHSLVLANCLGERFRSLRLQERTPAIRGSVRCLAIQLVRETTCNLGWRNLTECRRCWQLIMRSNTWCSTRGSWTVHSDIAQIVEHAVGSITHPTRTEEVRTLVDETGVQHTGGKVLVVEDVQQEVNVCGHTTNAELLESTLHLHASQLEVGRVRDALDQQRIIVRTDTNTTVRNVIQADTHASGSSIDRECTGVWLKVLSWILSRDTALNGGTIGTDLALEEANITETLSLCNTNLSLHKVSTSDFFGNGVFHLNTWVNFDKVMLVSFRIHKELESTSIAVASSLGQTNSVVAELFAKSRIQSNCRCDLDHLLVTTLNRAIAFEQVHHITLAIGQDLNLDMTRVQEVGLGKDSPVAKELFTFADTTRIGFFHLGHVAHHTHATTAATHGRLEDDRQTGLLCERPRILGRTNWTITAWHHRNVGRGGELSGSSLVAQ